MPPKKKKLAAIIKLQIKAGAANPAPPVGPALGQHGVNIMEFCKAVQRGDRVAARPDRPGRDLGLRGPLVHLRHQDAAGRPAAARGRRRREGQRRAAQDEGRQGHDGPGARDREDQDGRPQRQRHRPGREDHRRHRPLDGHHRRGLTSTPCLTSAWRRAGVMRSRTAHDCGRAPKAGACSTTTMKRSISHEAQQGLPQGRRAHRSRTRSTPRSRRPSSPRRRRRPSSTRTVEVALRLGVDPRKADQMVRGTVSLPHGTGKTARVIVFATGDKAAEAEAAGADRVGSDDLIAEIQGGFLDFDAAIATPDQMAKVGRIARVLGPRGLMPNPKTGTVTPDVAKAVSRHQGRQDQLPGRQAVQPAPGDRQGVVQRDSSWSRTTPRRSTRSCGPSRRRPRAGTSRRSPSPRRWARASRSTRTAPATCSRTSIPRPERPSRLPRARLAARAARCVPSLQFHRRPLVVAYAYATEHLRSAGAARAGRTVGSAPCRPVRLRRGVSRLPRCGQPETTERRNHAERREGRCGHRDHRAVQPSSSAAVITEYRGLTVQASHRSAPDAGQRHDLRRRQEHPDQAGSRRMPASDSTTSLLVGPTAIAFVTG